MKKTSLITTVVLAVALVVLYVLHFTGIGAAPKHKPLVVSDSTQVGPASVVFLQMDSLLSKYDLFLDLQAELSGKAKVVEDDLNKKGRAFEKDVTNFQEKVQKGLITRSQAETQQNQLAARQQELEQYAQQKQMELAEEEQVMLNRVLDSIKTFLAEYRVLNGYDVILTTAASSNAVISGSPLLDITQQVVANLNAVYAKSIGK